YIYFFFSSRRRHTRSKRDWSSDVCSSDLKLDISKHDKVSHNLNTEIKDGLVINIDKAYKIPVNYAEEKESIWTTGGTVGEILSENDFKIKKSDKVKPDK